MTPSIARQYTRSALATNVGTDALRSLVGRDNAALIAGDPGRTDDASAMRLAEMLRAELHRRYPVLF